MRPLLALSNHFALSLDFDLTQCFRIKIFIYLFKKRNVNIFGHREIYSISTILWFASRVPFSSCLFNTAQVNDVIALMRLKLEIVCGLRLLKNWRYSYCVTILLFSMHSRCSMNSDRSRFSHPCFVNNTCHYFVKGACPVFIYCEFHRKNDVHDLI